MSSSSYITTEHFTMTIREYNQLRRMIYQYYGPMDDNLLNTEDIEKIQRASNNQQLKIKRLLSAIRNFRPLTPKNSSQLLANLHRYFSPVSPKDEVFHEADPLLPAPPPRTRLPTTELLPKDLWHWLVVYFNLPKEQRHQAKELYAALADHKYTRMPKIPVIFRDNPALYNQARELRHLHKQLFSNLKDDGHHRRSPRNMPTSLALLADYEETLTQLVPNLTAWRKP